MRATSEWAINYNYIIIRYRMRALSHDRGSNLTKKFALINLLQKLPFAFAQNVLGRANSAILWRQFFD